MSRARSQQGGSTALETINASLSRMEVLIQTHGRTPARSRSRPDGVSPLATRSIGSPTPAKPVGPVDARGHPLVPRSQYLRSVVSAESAASASPSVVRSTTAEPSDVHGRGFAAPTEAFAAHHRTQPVVKSTMARKLEEDLAECTFQPNKRKHVDPENTPPATTAAPSRALAKSQPSASTTKNDNDIFSRLYHKPTGNLSRGVADKFSKNRPQGAAGGVPAANGRTHHQQQADARRAKGAAATSAAAANMSSSNNSSAAPSSAIFDRLLKDAATRAERRVNQPVAPKRAVPNAVVLASVKKLAEQERERQKRLEDLRRKREELERQEVEMQRRKLHAHIQERHAALRAQHKDRPVVHHSTTSSGIDSTMVMTPNGTWQRSVHARLDASSSNVPSRSSPPQPEETNDASQVTDDDGARGRSRSPEQNTAAPPAQRRPDSVSKLDFDAMRRQQAARRRR